LNDSVLIVGADGTVGRSLVAAFEAAGKTVWQTTRKQDQVGGQRILLDLSQEIIHSPLPPTHIGTAIICAAVTSLERCRLDPNYSRQINVVGTVALAKRLIKGGVFVIFLSTNLVFNGEAPFAKPTDPVNPLTEYGRQKAEAEAQFLAWKGQTAIVRFSKILSPGMPLFQGWIRDLEAGKVIHPFSDMVMAPVSLKFAVRVLHEVTERRLPGIFQVSAIQDISYAAAARHIARRLGADMQLVQPISCHEAGVDFSPLYTSLDTGRLADFGIQAPQVVDAFHEIEFPDYAIVTK